MYVLGVNDNLKLSYNCLMLQVVVVVVRLFGLGVHYVE